MTRYVPLLLFICALIAACGMALRVTVPLSWFAYLVALCLTSLFTFWSLARTSPYERAYLAIYSLVSLLAILLVAFIAFRFSRNLPSLVAFFACVGAMFWASALLMVARWYLTGIYHRIPIETNTILARSWLLLVCGSVTFLSLIVEPTAIGKVFRFFLGGYWLAMAYAGFCFAVGIVQYRALSIKLNLIVPAMIGIIAFGGLAFELSKLQAELSRQPVAVEQAVATGEAR